MTLFKTTRHRPSPGRPLCLTILFLSATTASQAALEADFLTTRGTITVRLEYQKAPKAVASLITLSQGTRSWYEPADGSVRREPFYQALTFDSVTVTTSDKRAEIGAVDPGYRFQDELDASLLHEPYVLSMANQGPNTNGARLTFTGSAPLPDRDGRHTVFGKIPDNISRAVIDSILATGSGNTTITGVVIRRTDPAALAFDESAVPLPQVRALNGPLQVIPGGQVNLLFLQPTVSVLRATASPDLVSWQPRFHRFRGIDDAPAGAFVTIDNANHPSQFYQISLAHYPEIPQAGGPSNFANRTLMIEGPGTGTLIYQFDPTGLAGTYQNILLPGEPPFFAGNFQVLPELPPEFGPYAFRILIHAEGLGGAPFNLIRGGIDTVEAGSVSGRHVVSMQDVNQSPVFEDSGTLTLTRP
jgi:peptidyl-prolyl cis-trans isomerase A (cyclophilin A)